VTPVVWNPLKNPERRDPMWFSDEGRPLKKRARRRRKKPVSVKPKASPKRIPDGWPVADFTLFGDFAKMLTRFSGGTWRYLTPHVVGDPSQGRCDRVEGGASFPEVTRIPVKRAGLLSDDLSRKKWRCFLLEPGLYEIAYFRGFMLANGYVAIPKKGGEPLTFTDGDTAVAWIWDCPPDRIAARHRNRQEEAVAELEDLRLKLLENLQEIGLPVPRFPGNGDAEIIRLSRVETELAALQAARAKAKTRERKTTTERRRLEEERIFDRIDRLLACLDVAAWLEWRFAPTDEFLDFLEARLEIRRRKSSPS
jgi:hypothetical protein